MSEKYDRQIDLINFLLRGGRTTIFRLSRELEVGLHTVKRDIAQLQFHFPIDTFTGRGGGVEMNKCFVLQGYFLKKQQVDLIAYALTYLIDNENNTEAKKLYDFLFINKGNNKAI